MLHVFAIKAPHTAQRSANMTFFLSDEWMISIDFSFLIKVFPEALLSNWTGSFSFSQTSA